MEYLYKIYYKDKNFYEETYKNRINFEESLRTGLFIKSLKEQEESQLYFVYNMKTSKLIDRVMQNDNIKDFVNSRRYDIYSIWIFDLF